MVAFVLAAMLRLSWPSLVPPGRGPDLTHHLLLVDYIEQQRHLVHDRSLDGAMGEMAHYTPARAPARGGVGAWFGVDGLRAFFPLLAVCAALTAGFVFLIARRLQLPLPYAIAAVVLLFLPAQYFFGAFTHDSFLAQTVVDVLRRGGVVGDGRSGMTSRSTVGAVAIAMLSGRAVFLSWPIWIGPLVLVFCAPLLRPAARTPGEAAPRVRPRAAHSGHRARAVARRRVDAFVGPLGLAGDRSHERRRARAEPGEPRLGCCRCSRLLGMVAGLRDRRARVTIVLLVLIVLQALTLFVIAKAQGADTPYMAFKMVYLAIYPMAVLAAVAMASPERAWLARRREAGESKGEPGG